MSEDSIYVPGSNSWANTQVSAYESSNGAEQGDLRGVPVIILTTRGRKSGALRKAPLMRVSDGEKYAVIASLGGAPEHPVWYLNLQAHPEVTLQDKDVTRRYRAHTAVAEEREQWWARAAAVWPDYNRYQLKTHREIPVVVLEPLDERPPLPE
ncbi:MAG: nitroreductase family deazaflavin-dependent oxidoreductase [Nakamurella sp.]